MVLRTSHMSVDLHANDAVNAQGNLRNLDLQFHKESFALWLSPCRMSAGLPRYPSRARLLDRVPPRKVENDVLNIRSGNLKPNSRWFGKTTGTDKKSKQNFSDNNISHTYT